MRSIDILEFKEVMAEAISLVEGWTGSDDDNRRLACIISATSLLEQKEREHIAKLLVKAQIVKAKELKAGMEDGKTPVPMALFEDMVDIVTDSKGRPSFLMINEGKLVIAPAAEDMDRRFEILTPPPVKMIPWLLCRGEMVLKHVDTDDNSKLWDDVVERLQLISELPSLGYYDLLTAWIFHSWIVNEFEYSPMIWFFGLPERGKTRTGKGLLSLCWRGLHVESLRDAYLIRMANNFLCSIFFDVQELWGKAERYGSTDIILHRYEKGAQVHRVLWPDRGPFKDTASFKVFGPTLVATNEEVPEVLASRAIQIQMPGSSKKFEDLKPSDLLHLKERFCAFRFRMMLNQMTLPEVQKKGKGRLGDIFRPLHQVIRLIRPDREQQVFGVMREIDEQRRIFRSDSLEGVLVECLLDLETKVENGLLKIKEVTEAFNREAQGYHLRPESIGKKLRGMGFRGKSTSNARYIFYDVALLDVLRERMGQ